jgi:hypothetical protein
MSADAHTMASSGLGGRANKPGPRKLYLGAVLAAIVAAVVVVIAISSGGNSTASRAMLNASVLHLPKTKVYGHPAKWLKIPYPQKLPQPTASAAHPDLQQQAGYAVAVTLPHGSTKLFMAGPLLPRDLANNVSTHKTSLFSSVPGRFEVDFSGTKGTVPLSTQQFTLINYRGVVTHPKVTLANGDPLPATVPVGKTLKLTFVERVPEGDGLIRWAPFEKQILVGTFWTTEFD